MSRFWVSVCLLLLVSSLAVFAAGAEGEPAVPTRFELTWRGPAIQQAELELYAAGSSDAVLRIPIGPEGEATASLRGGSRWRAVLKAAGYWAAEAHFTAGESVRIPVWPTAVVHWRPAAHRGVAEPEAIEARFEAVPGPDRASRIPLGVVPCVRGEKEWKCEIPAGRLDLALRAKGFAPWYRWDLLLRPGAAQELEEVVWKAGASLRGRVETEQGNLDPKRAVAVLEPLVAPGVSPTQAHRLRKGSTRAAIHPRGHFQFVGVAPGSYRLRVEQPGMAEAVAYPLEVWEGMETSLKAPLVLRPPLALRLRVRPTVDWLGKPWQAQIYRASDFSAGFDHEPAYRGVVGEDGTLALPGQSPGYFWVHLRDSAGNSLYSEQGIPVLDAASSEIDIELDLVVVEGTVHLGEAPLPSTLFFGGKHGSRSVRMEADEEGRLTGVLPKAGSWQVEVEAWEPPVSTFVRAHVEPDSYGRAELEIELPDTRLFGIVLTEEGRPVEGARVTLGTDIRSLLTRTDEAGSFEFRAAPPGLSTVSARALELGGVVLSSPPQLHILNEASDIGPIELRVEPWRILPGFVRSERGPVAGAHIDISTLEPMLVYGGRGETRYDGRFEVSLPRRAELLRVVVSPPGHALTVQVLRVQDGPAELRVPVEGGTLRLATHGEAALGDDVEIEVFQDGQLLPLPTLLRWAQGHGVPIRFGQQSTQTSELRLPQLAPGNYRVCWRPGHTEGADGRESVRCAEASLGPGEEVSLAPDH